MEDKLLELYIFAEMRYQEHFKNVDPDELYPAGWYKYNDYKLKIEIIVEAIKTNTLIVNTESYLKIIEGVKDIF